MKDAHGEFPFIDPTFIPVGRPDVLEYEGGMMHDDLPSTYEPANQVVQVEKPIYQSTPSSMIASSSLLASKDPPVGSKADIATPRITPILKQIVLLSAVLKAKKKRRTEENHNSTC